MKNLINLSSNKNDAKRIDYILDELPTGNIQNEYQNYKYKFKKISDSKKVISNLKIVIKNINYLSDFWFKRIVDKKILNKNEIISLNIKPNKSQYFFLLFVKINYLINKLIKSIYYDGISFIWVNKLLSDNAKTWLLVKIPLKKINYKQKIKKIFIYINALNDKNYDLDLYLIDRVSYNTIIDFPSRKEIIFEKKINKIIYLLNNNIQNFFDKKILLENSDNNVIEVFNGYKIYSSPSNNVTVLKDINLKIKKGEFVLLLGPSGSGKTTLMNCLAGIDQLSFGDVIINNKNITKLTDHSLTKFRKDNTSYIFQHYGLLYNLNVEENILMGCYLKNKIYDWRNKKIHYKKDKIFVNNLMKEFDLYKDREKMVFELSGGMRQRVAIARAIAKKSDILFADEPTSALDEGSTKIVMNLLKDIHKKYNLTIIMITHNEKILDYGNHIIELRDGIIIRDKIRN
ncbi:MAG: ATP-binding cassette domain-containing protein [Mycoplasmoidaceae bacterium]